MFNTARILFFTNSLKRMFVSSMQVIFLQYQWAVGKFNSRYFYQKFRSNLDFSTVNFLIFLKPLRFFFFYIFSSIVLSALSLLKISFKW